jgi:ribosomal protein S27AE
MASSRPFEWHGTEGLEAKLAAGALRPEIARLVYEELGRRGWKKIVQVVAVSACPKCGNSGFDLEPGADIDDPHARIRCGKCGYVDQAAKFMKPVNPTDNPN